MYHVWNRCDICGHFISFSDFDNGAIRRLDTPDSEFTAEAYETLCKKHAPEALGSEGPHL